MKNKLLYTAMIVASIGIFVEYRLVAIGIIIALTGLFVQKEIK